MRASNWIQQADQAMIRAAARAKVVAANTNTPIHVMKDGKVVEIWPEKEPQRAKPTQLQEESEISVVREDPPPYGTEHP